MYRIANPFGERHFSGICAANRTVFRHRDRVVDHGPAGLDVDPLDESAEERLRLGDVAGAQELDQVGGELDDDFSLVEQHAELDGTGPVTISQALATVAGWSNTVAFDYRARPGTGGATNGLSATWNGVEIAPGLTFTGAWQSHTAQVTGTGSDTLAISDTGTADGVGTLLDNVTVTALDSQPPVVTPVVSITGGSAITEGGTASFTITASPAPASSITVNIGVSQSGAFGASGAATVNVADNDAPPVDVDPLDIEVVEASAAKGGYLTFTVRLSRAPGEALTLMWNTATAWDEDERAHEGSDYEYVYDDLVFGSGDSEATGKVWLYEDSDAERSEAFEVQVFLPATSGRPMRPA